MTPTLFTKRIIQPITQHLIKCLVVCFSFCLSPLLLCGGLSIHQAFARPATRVVSQVEGDASVSLTLESQYIDEDSQIPCELTVEVLGENRPFTQGDTIRIRVIEDDSIFGDDTLWEVEVIADEAIAELQIFSMTYDCSFAAVGDQLGSIEVYASVEVDKDDCGRLCELGFGEDTPSTPNIYMNRLIDDDAEEDDDRESAFTDPQRLTSDRIARDADWFLVEYGYSVELLARLESLFQGGDLSLKLYDQNQNLIAEANAEAGGTSKSLRPPSVLAPGQYWLEVTPVDPTNFNFYDLYIVESQVMSDCRAGDVETRPCGFCGREERACNDGGQWGAWSACLGVGMCEPGQEESEGCEGGGSRARVCDSLCQWGAFTECIQCEDGAMEACYTGPEDRAGVGECAEGTRTCSRGQWSSCQGDVLPRAEICLDGLDNDCNGFTDINDPECTATVGDACTPGGCGDLLSCLMGPFIGGYCGGDNCANCPVGSVCAAVADQEYCLAPCDDDQECRGGYGCAPVGRSGERVCAPLCSGDADCGANQVCNNARYCEERGGGEVSQGGLGAACTQSGDCESPLECLTDPFLGGYCGNRGCAQCGSGGACGTVRGQPFCLQLCASVNECRAGYLCAPVGLQGESLCVPPCQSDVDCESGSLCNAQSYCEPQVSMPNLPAECGTMGACALGQACMMSPETGELGCINTCMLDSECPQGYSCSSTQICELAAEPNLPQPTTAEEGCQQQTRSSLGWMFIFALLLNFNLRLRRLYDNNWT